MDDSSETRQVKLKLWLRTLFDDDSIIPERVAGDASFRSYYRVHQADKSFIVMDAPPDKENCHRFIEIDELLQAHHINAPKIFKQNTSDGFLLLEDFGNRLFSDGLNESPELLYKNAIDALLDMQAVTIPIHLEAYDLNFILTESERFETWFLDKFLDVQLNSKEQASLKTLYELFLNAAKQQPYVFTHRDYHSRNLLIKPDDTLGIIDFQDAIQGPIVYDLVSLLKDCYIKWPRRWIIKLCEYYLEGAKVRNLLPPEVNLEQFLYWFDMIGLQRHIKVLGIFSRLALRDGKPTYLNDLPRVIEYIEEVMSLYLEIHTYETMFNRFFNRYRETHYEEVMHS